MWEFDTHQQIKWNVCLSEILLKKEVWIQKKSHFIPSRKEPQRHNLRFLLQIFHLNPDQILLHMVKKSITNK